MASLGFATDLALWQRRSASAVAVAAITSLTVLGATPLPDGADAAVMNGCGAVAVIPDIGGSSFVPGLIVLTVRDPGFDGDGDTTTVTRTITGTAVVRRQYPNQSQRLNVTGGGARTVHFALSDDIYQGSTIVSAVASAGFYGAAAAGIIASVSNGSTLAYPRPLFAWLNMQHERATGAGLAVEGVAYHRHAMNGRQVACVQYWGRDAQPTPNLSAVQTVSSPALSDLQTGGPRVEAWKAAIPLAGLTQGDLCSVSATVFPWIGNSSAVLDLWTDGVLPTGNVQTAQPATPLRVLNDRTGSYGGGEAWVKSGAVSGAVGSSATPYPTVQAALAALATWNGANRGHSDHSGSTIWLMETSAGAGADHAIGSSAATVAGKCWSDVRVDPAATGPVRLILSALVPVADLVRFRCPIFRDVSGYAAFDGGSTTNLKRIAFDSGASDICGTNVPGIGLTYEIGLGYWRNTLFANAPCPFHTFSTVRNCSALVLGCSGTFHASQTVATPYAFVGNAFERARIGEFGAAVVTAFPLDGGIIANNVMMKCPQVSRLAMARPLNGFARVQNVFEPTGYVSSPGWQIGGDEGAVGIANFVSMHNTISGVGVGSGNIARENIAYMDAASTVGVQKAITQRFDLIHQRNCKPDTHTALSSVTGRTGNWRFRYGVGGVGLVVVTGDAELGAGSAADPSGGNWSGEYLESGSTFYSGEAGVTFADNRAGTAGAGGGIYVLTGADNAAYGRVPAGLAALGRDLAGNARRNDGSGAAGAYERTIG